MKRYDSLVIGAGPAGFAATLYLARFGVQVALVEKLGTGGLLLQTDMIENYPGFPKGIKGFEMADSFDSHLEPYANISRISGDIAEFDLTGESKRVLIDGEWIEAKTILICSGVRHRKLGVPGEEKYLGKGLSHCALCDGNFFRNQKVAVVGGGNSAIEESLYLAKIVSELHLIHRRDDFRAASIYVSRLEALPNVHLERSSVITTLYGDDLLEGVIIKKLRTGEEKRLAVSGLFVFIGFEPSSSFLSKSDLQLDQNGFLITDTEMRTNIPGVFAAGDIRSKKCRQVVTAVGDGATAANSAFTYLEQSHD